MTNMAALGYLQLALEMDNSLTAKQKEKIMSSMEFAFDIMTEEEAEQKYLDSM